MRTRSSIRNPKGPTRQAYSKLALVSTLTCDAMWQLWPYLPAQALPKYRYDEIRRRLCKCANRGHRRDDCPVKDKKRCIVCGIAYKDNGSISSHCNQCLDYQDARQNYLAQWVLDNRPNSAPHVNGFQKALNI